ncbi:thiol reductant ABC exporter subunit CydC [Actinomycetaceae bacterium MB13-C1-2]|nr:thiol reductant ABC exporter subunit CydC [Actinomycetaceae bacterium MB13-C1-2]
MKWILTAPERAALDRAVRMLKIRKADFALALFYGVAGLGSAIGLAAVSAWLIARASQMPPVLYLTVAATSVRMFGVLRALLRYLQRLASHQVALDGMDSLRLGVYDALAEAPVDQVAKLQRGDLLSRIGSDIDAVGDYVVKSMLPFAVTAIVGVGTVIGFAFLSVPAAIVIALGLVVSGIVAPLLTARSAREAEALEQSSKTDLSVVAMTILESADELVVSGNLDQAEADVDTASADLNTARAKAARPAALASALDRLAMGLTVVGVLIVSIPETNAGLVAAVALAVLALTPLAAFEGTADLGPASVQLIKSARAAERIMALLGPDDKISQQAHQIPGFDSTPPRVEMVAQDLEVGWPGREVAVTNINLEIAPGTVTAIVGPSGVGKTTLLYTLAGMLAPRGGTADLNGVPLWNGDRNEVTHLVSLTTEDSHVFATTVYENLRVASADLSRDEAGVLLGQVGLGEWFAGLPKGLDTLLGVGATTISGGERRRLLLARALASPARILLLDEPGEHLDGQTADQIMSSLFEGSGSERGLVVVTHRLSGLEKATRIVQLVPGDGGPAIARIANSHEELLAGDSGYRWAMEQE